MTTLQKAAPFIVRHSNTPYHLLPYAGNKAGFADIFASLIPDNVKTKKIYDVFGGGASFSIYCSYRFGSKNVTYNDNNPVIINFLKTVKNNPGKLYDEYQKHRAKSSDDYYREVQDMTLDDGVVGAGKFLYLAKNAFSGKIFFTKKGRFGQSRSKSKKCPELDLNRLKNVSNAIRNITIKNESYEYFEDVKNSFLYLDPPYLHNPFGHYNGVPDADAFIGFMKKIEKRNMVMLSEQNTPETLRLSEDYRVYPVLLRRSVCKTPQQGREIIAINYSPAEQGKQETL